MVDGPFTGLHINKLGARTGRKKVPVRGPGPIAAMVEPIRVHRTGELPFYLTRAGITTDEQAVTTALCQIGRPDQIIDYDQILRGLVSAERVFTRP